MKVETIYVCFVYYKLGCLQDSIKNNSRARLRLRLLSDRSLLLLNLIFASQTLYKTDIQLI